MRSVSVCSLVGVVLMTVPATAGAQSRPSDPEADSPSGVVYELPVDRARKDAAPRRGSSQRGEDQETNSSGGDSPGGGSSGSTGGGTTGGEGSAAGANETSIRSENNFGTSSRVPGASRGDAGRRNGGEAPGEADGVGPVGSLGDLAPSSAAGADGPSDGVVFLLLAALLGVGAVIGVVAGRRASRDQGG